MRVLQAFVVLICTHLSMSLNILVYLNLLGKSHLDFTSSLINVLTERGHTVDFIITRMNAVGKTNGTHAARRVVNVAMPGSDSSWSKLPHLTRPFEPNALWEQNYIHNEWSFFTRSCNAICEQVMQSREVDELLTTNAYDVALVSGYDFCPHAVAHHYGIKKIVSFSALPTSWQETYGSGVPLLPAYRMDKLDARKRVDLSTTYGRVINMLRIFANKYEQWKMFRFADQTYSKYYGKDIPSTQEMANNVSFEFANSNALLESPIPTTPRIRYIGGINVPTPKKLNEEFDYLLNSRRAGAVIISFGSQVKADGIPPNVVESFVAAAEAFPEYTFIWKYEREIHNKPANLNTTTWLPQTDLLFDTRVHAFISHMGMNSFMEAAYGGVPLLCIPLFADQFHNAHAVAQLGLGVVVRKTEVTPDNVINGLKQILNDENGYRSRSRKNARMLKAIPGSPKRIFVETMEFAAQFEHLHERLRLPGGDLYFWQHVGYDAILILFVLSVLVVCSLIFALCKVGQVARFLLVGPKAKLD